MPVYNLLTRNTDEDDWTPRLEVDNNIVTLSNVQPVLTQAAITLVLNGEPQCQVEDSSGVRLLTIKSL